MRANGDAMRERMRQAIIELSTQNPSRPPTMRELGDHIGIKSISHIRHHLEKMRELGLIKPSDGKSRGIMLTDPVAAESHGISSGVLRLPLRGRIAAGQPIEAIDDPDEYIDISAPALQGGDLYALRVRGKSMIDDLIDDNDVVIVRAQDSAVNGDTVVALLTNGTSSAGEVTLKRYYREKDRIRLQPANMTMTPIYVQADDVRIQGKVVAVFRQV